MKYYYLIIYVTLLLLSGCNTSHNLYYQDNKFIEKEINQIDGCDGFAQKIRNNFFFNKKDSLYVENFGFFIHEIMNNYSDCIHNLTDDQIISLFGIPHHKENGILYYLTKSTDGLSSTTMGRTFYSNEDSILLVGQNGFHGNFENLDNIMNNPNLKKASFLKSNKKISVTNNKDIHSNCLNRKNNLNNEVFYHKKLKYYIVNSLLLHFIYDKGYQIPCNESFSKTEIEDLMGAPNYKDENNIYFSLYNSSYNSQTITNEKWNNMTYCCVFSKTDNNLFKCSFKMVDSLLLKENKKNR